MVRLCRRSRTLSLFLFVFSRQIYRFTHLASAGLGTSNVPSVSSPEGADAHGVQNLWTSTLALSFHKRSLVKRLISKLTVICKPSISLHLNYTIKVHRSTSRRQNGILLHFSIKMVYHIHPFLPVQGWKQF